MDPLEKQAKQLNYKQPTLVATLIRDVLPCFSYRIESCELERRKKVKLLSLVGKIPVPDIEKDVPIQIWLPIDFPLQPPIIKALLKKTSLINPKGCVNTDGSIRHECLEQWDKRYRLVDCLKCLMKEFREVFPVFDLSHFKNAADAKKDLGEVLLHFPDMELSWSNYTNHRNEVSVELKLEAVLQDATEIPIQIWIFNTFPKTAPDVKVSIDDRISEKIKDRAKPSQDYLHKWKYRGKSLLEFLQLLMHDISHEPFCSGFGNRCGFYSVAVKEAEKESIATASSTSSDSSSRILLQKNEIYQEVESFVNQIGLDKDTEHVLIANGFKTRKAILAMREEDISKLGLPLGQECLLRDELSTMKKFDHHKDYYTTGISADRITLSSVKLDGGDTEYCRDMFARATKSLLKPLMVDESQLTIKEEIGRGEFGVVYKGILQRSIATPPEDVAVKTIFLSSHSRRLMDDFVEEILQMQKLNHKNILPLKALIILECKPYMVLPFMANGDLRTYLMNPEKKLTVGKLLELALDVAYGMRYLNDQNFIHGDLAARNCLVDMDHTVKVGDFGLAKQLHLTEYYRLDMKDKRPVRWMAPETMFKYVYTFKSDVWSFGILMWEIMSRGKRPYPEIADVGVLVESIKNGYRMQCPQHTPSDICNLMSRCWKTEQNERPNFTEIVSVLEAVLQDETNSPEYLIHQFRPSLTDSFPAVTESTREQPPLPPRTPRRLEKKNTMFAE